MLVQVTQDHIQRGKRGSTSGCPIALALCDMGHECVHTTYTYSSMQKSSIDVNRRYYKMPRIASEFVCAFDRGDPVQPMKFILDVPLGWR